MGNVTIRQCKDAKDYKVLEEMYSDPDIAATFDNYRKDRVIASNITVLIYYDENPAGFILCFEDKNNNISNIDAGVLKQYRRSGVFTQALKLLLQALIEYKVIETQVKKNSGISKVLEENGFKKHSEEGDSEFYIKTNK